MYGMDLDFHQKRLSAMKFRLDLFLVVFILRDLFARSLNRKSRWKSKPAPLAENIRWTGHPFIAKLCVISNIKFIVLLLLFLL